MWGGGGVLNIFENGEALIFVYSLILVRDKVRGGGGGREGWWD